MELELDGEPEPDEEKVLLAAELKKIHELEMRSLDDEVEVTSDE